MTEAEILALAISDLSTARQAYDEARVAADEAEKRMIAAGSVVSSARRSVDRIVEAQAGYDDAHYFNMAGQLVPDVFDQS